MLGLQLYYLPVELEVECLLHSSSSLNLVCVIVCGNYRETRKPTEKCTLFIFIYYGLVELQLASHVQILDI